MVQGVYYYFYQIFRNKAEAASLERLKLGIGDGSVGMFSSLVVAALSGWSILFMKSNILNSLYFLDFYSQIIGVIDFGYTI